MASSSWLKNWHGVTGDASSETYLRGDGVFATAGGPGSGEANVGANVGTSGVGVYDGKTGVTLNFRKLSAASARVTVALTSQSIDVDVPSNAFEAAGAVSSHAGLADPHTGYQLESEKGVASGYAGLNASSGLNVGGPSTLGTLTAGATTLASIIITGALQSSNSTLSNLSVGGGSTLNTVQAGASTLASLVVPNALQSSNSTHANLSVPGGSTLGTLQSGNSTLGALSGGASTLTSLVVNNAFQSSNSTVVNLSVSGGSTLGALTAGNSSVNALHVAGGSSHVGAAIFTGGLQSSNSTLTNLNVTGGSTVGALTAGNSSVAALHVVGGSTYAGGMSLTSTSGFAIADGTPAVTGNKLYNIGGSLYFNGAAVGGAASTTYSSGLLVSSGQFTVSSNSSLAGALHVGAASTFGAGLLISSGQFTVSSNSSLTGALHVNAGSSFVGAAIFKGGLQSSNSTLTNLNVTGGTTTVTLSAGNSTVSNFNATGGATAVTLSAGNSTIGSLQVTGNSTITALQAGNSTVAAFTANASTLASLQVTGASSYAGQMNLTSTSGFSIVDGTPAAVTNKLYNIGGNLYFNGAQLAAGSQSTLFSSGLLLSSGQLTVSTNSSLAGALHVGGASSFAGQMNLTSTSGLSIVAGTPAVVTNKLYNISGALYFNGAPVSPVIAKITADSTRSSTVLADLTGLSFSLTSGTYYSYWFLLPHRSVSTATGLAVSVTYPAVYTASAGVTGWNRDTTTSTSITANSIRASGGRVEMPAVPSTSADTMLEIRGVVVPSAAGTLQVQFASEVNASEVRVRQGACGFLYTM